MKPGKVHEARSRSLLTVLSLILAVSLLNCPRPEPEQSKEMAAPQWLELAGYEQMVIPADNPMTEAKVELCECAEAEQVDFEETERFDVIFVPLDDGALHDTDACALPAVAITSVGAPGVVTGVTALEALDAELVPTPFVAVTVKV